MAACRQTGGKPVEGHGYTVDLGRICLGNEGKFHTRQSIRGCLKTLSCLLLPLRRRGNENAGVAVLHSRVVLGSCLEIQKEQAGRFKQNR